MPQTKIQKIVFGVMMALVMVYGMELYNAALHNGGLSNKLFLIPLKEYLLIFVIVMIVESLLAGPIARRLAFKIVDPRKDRPIFIILAMSVMMVCFMCPTMSLIATLLFNGFSSEIIAIWIQTLVLNFPIALGLQLFIAGPLVRFIFKKIFQKQILKDNAPAM